MMGFNPRTTKMLVEEEGELKMYWTVLLSQRLIIMQKHVPVSILKTTNLFSTTVIWDPTGWHTRRCRENLEGYCWFGALIHQATWLRFPLSEATITWWPHCNSSQLGVHNTQNTIRTWKCTKEKRIGYIFSQFFTLVEFLYSKLGKELKSYWHWVWHCLCSSTVLHLSR